MLDKPGDEILVNMFDGVEAEPGSTTTEDRMNPHSPVVKISGNIWVSLVDIGTHWMNYA